MCAYIKYIYRQTKIYAEHTHTTYTICVSEEPFAILGFLKCIDSNG